MNLFVLLHFYQAVFKCIIHVPASSESLAGVSCIELCVQQANRRQKNFVVLTKQTAQVKLCYCIQMFA